MSLVLGLTFACLLLWLLKKYFAGARYHGPYPELSGRYAVVTGGGGGIGREAVWDLATRGCRVLVADIADATRLAQEINSNLGKELVEWAKVDLGDLTSIDALIRRIRFPRLDFLVNNAGVMGVPLLSYTKSGYETHFGVNYVGHFYLTYRLMPLLRKSQFFRIVNVSSVTHNRVLGFLSPTTFQFHKFNFESLAYDKDVAYARSKLYLVLFARALAQNIPKNKGLVVSVHPGVARSGITQHMFCGYKNILINLVYPLYWLVTKSCEQAVQTILYVLYQNNDKLESGSYYADCRLSARNPLVDLHWRKMHQVTTQMLKLNPWRY